ncbi:MAG: phosphoserine phosphatase SerB [Reyranella sp.]|uniref:phosphoserine phosphatase SerB n=1 Tax=Reyranella sp. TaxID=1929291 RepID=UPI0012292CCC|nr:phosphoserine phosphatase SerB [Reyranella sp.]TAJ88442.1 MAG: phosphoserine phosphatase SerB [Reyranella sp.]TBR24529.1 MAG: phosphoserine phosphatase SerB [Reyranella sp.]
MKNVLVLISDPSRPAVTEAAVAAATDALKSGGATVGAPDWLDGEIACDLPFDGPAAPVSLPGVDAVALPAAGRRKKLLVADMESTMIHNEMLDELAEFLGLREKIAGITARAMNGEIDFAGALEERVGLLKGLPVGRLDEAATRIRYMPGGATLVATMQKHGAYCALVSGGFTYFTAMVRRSLGFDLDAANVLQHDGTSLAGTVARPILGKEAKLTTLQRLAGERSITVGDAVSVGDGANDLPMLRAAGLGVAFHAKPAVAAQVPARIEHGDLSALLYLQGYRRSDFEERKDP